MKPSSPLGAGKKKPNADFDEQNIAAAKIILRKDPQKESLAAIWARAILEKAATRR
jgi:hypothetical protein